jgi:flagellar basal-body rod modification protein FlgD
MNIIHSIVNPLASLITGSSVATSKANDASTGSSPGSSTAAPSNSLNANSFITLLTTELQAQDPLNPMDPTQFVDQLTSLNSLQQLIQIQQDLAPSSGAPVTGTAGTSGPGAGSGTPGNVPTGNATGVTHANAISRIAAALQAPGAGGSSGNLLSSLQSLLNNSLATSPSAAAAMYSKLGAQSKLF